MGTGRGRGKLRHDLAYGAVVGKSRTEFRLKAERVLPSR